MRRLLPVHRRVHALPSPASLARFRLHLALIAGLLVEPASILCWWRLSGGSFLCVWVGHVRGLCDVCGQALPGLLRAGGMCGRAACQSTPVQFPVQAAAQEGPGEWVCWLDGWARSVARVCLLSCVRLPRGVCCASGRAS